jgi:uncharacterized repeat protein (TIGR03806 family)
MVHRIGTATMIAVGMLALAAAHGDDAAPKRRAYGLEKRVPWTSSRVHGTPDPAPPFRAQNAFPKLRFHEPLVLAQVPGQPRLAVAERPGRVLTFDNRRDVAAAELMLDIKRTVYGMALHPQFATNGYFYLTSIVDPAESPRGSRISRFTVSRPDQLPLHADADSEKVIFEWPSGGHNGGCLQFGPDGFLYLATGDGSGIADQLETGQDLTDLLGAIVRIDVDRPDGGRGYGIPADNPFVDLPRARPEIFSYGHRQVWRFSFDRQGRLWAGEVGQDLWEMIYIVQKGGNYRWSVQEGAHPFRPERKRGPTPILAPLVEHPHSDFRSITGGYVVESARIPELRGTYIYGDYDTGRIWGLKYDGKAVSEHRELDDTQLRVVAFGQDTAGEVFLVDFAGGGIHWLVPAPPTLESTADFPRKLSQTGLFASTKELTPAPGLIPYSVNSELWSDGAIKERYLAIPGEEKIEFDTVLYPNGAPGAEPGWRFPHDTVLVKTFALELEPGKPESRRRLETRLLHHKHMPGTEEYGDQYWLGYTYVWNDEQTDAELLGPQGLDRKFTIHERGATREQTWHFPSRAECTLCHTMAAKYALGVNTLQMNRDHNYGGVVANQLETLNHIGIFTEPMPKPASHYPRLADYRDPSQDLHLRARSYLHSNCSHCHRKWGGGNAEFILLASLSLKETGILGTRAGQGSFDIPEARIVQPGRPDKSLIHVRMGKLGLGRMPHVASNVIDKDALQLLEAWIRATHSAEVQERTGVIPGEQ